MNLRKLLAIFVVLISTGWLVPLWLGLQSYLSWLQLSDTQRHMFSFPHLYFAENCILVAFVWLGVALAFWSYVGYIALGHHRAA